MTISRLILLSIIMFVLGTQTMAQKIYTDSLKQYYLKNIEASDTISPQILPEYYKKIQEAADSKFEKELYDFIVQEPAIPQETLPEPDYKPYQDMTIRHIKIIVLKPFSTDINIPDSINTKSSVNNWLNKIHISTRETIVRNNLQFKEGQALNPLIIRETEAFLRNLDYINDVRIFIYQIPLTEDVEITIVVKDVWSIGVDISNFSTTSQDIKIYDKNFLGIGNRIDLNLIHKKSYSPQWGYGASYEYKNLWGTFTNFYGSYLDNISNQEVYFSVERPLETTLKYFGQIGYFYNHYQTDIVGWDSISPDYNQNFSVSFGRSFAIPDKHAIRRLVIAGRYIQKAPEYRDVILQEKLRPYQYIKSKMFLLQTSLYRQAYYREHLINCFGVTEDIAHGYNFSAQIGYSQFSESEKGMYGSLSASWGREYKSGNYYLEAAISSFFNKQKAYEGILDFGFHYFSPLIKSGKTRFRQFIDVDYSRLMNPLPQFDNPIYISSLTNLNTWRFADEAKGTERLMFSWENDIFTNINIIGFRFLFFNFVDAGWINSNGNLFSGDNFNYGFGVGVRVRNDLLVFNTINIKLGIYPKFDQNIGNYFNISTSSPTASPNFVPGYPQEISLE